MDNKAIREKYEGFAPVYDWAEGVPEALFVRRLRKRIFRRARGRILEVAAGTGRNFAFLPADAWIVAADATEGMLRRAREKARHLPVRASFAVMEVEALAFRDATFDTVMSSLSTCTFLDPVAALREMARVCRPDGRILLLEHGRSSREWIGRFQDRTADAHHRALACRWNREPHELARAAGLELVTHSRHVLGVLHVMEARPGAVR
ncbi:MAG TPA: methyltransferase domain-containing protein [Longimicrobiales bacterium]|nr:methyltransferase domain-containing protein [Longimicrobiales bacterium]